MKEELMGVIAGLVVCYFFYKVSDKNLIIITK